MEVVNSFKKRRLILSLSLLFLVFKPFNCSTKLKEEIPKGYNVLEPLLRPDGSATMVNVSVIVMGVRNIDEMEEAMIVEMNLRMYWTDLRLQHLANVSKGEKFRVLSPGLLKHIWHPDAFIDHVISIDQPSVITTPASLRIYNDSALRYSTRLNVKVVCGMDFYFYPMDTQHCPVQIKSYAYSSNIMNLVWTKPRDVFLAYPLELPNFNSQLERSRRYVFQTGSSNYSILEFSVSLSRNLSNQMMQSYLPSIIFVIVSWLSFLIPKDKVQERIGCCLVTLLSLTVMLDSVNKSMPPVTYLSALHIWMTASTFFVFTALTEFAIVLKLRSSAIALIRNMGETADEEEYVDIRQGVEEFQLEKSVERRRRLTILAGEIDGKRLRLIGIARSIERLAPFVYAFAFFLFNFIYWPWLIWGSY